MGCRLHFSTIEGGHLDVAQGFEEAMERCVPLQPAGNPLQSREQMTWTDAETGKSHMIHSSAIFWVEELD